MGETEVKRGGGLGFPQWKKNVRRRKSFDPSFLVQLHNNLQNSLKTQLKRFGKKDLGAKLGRNEKGCSDLMRVDLESQLQAWRENPSWTDPPPEIKVSVPKGSLCNLDVKVDVGLPPHAVYDIVTDPDNRRVFKNIKEVISRRVLVDEGERQVVEVEQAALWNFLWWSGTISVHVLVDQNRQDHTMKFKQLNTGIMKKFEGFWRVEPVFVDENICYPCKPKTWADYCSCTGGKGRVGSRVSLEQIIQPAIVPPPPISWYMRGITIKTTEMIANYLLDEAARIRGGKDYLQKEEPDTSATANDQDTQQNVEFCDIKERWALHRRRTRKHNQKFSTAK